MKIELESFELDAISDMIHIYLDPPTEREFVQQYNKAIRQMIKKGYWEFTTPEGVTGRFERYDPKKAPEPLADNQDRIFIGQ